MSEDNLKKEVNENAIFFLEYTNIVLDTIRRITLFKKKYGNHVPTLKRNTINSAVNYLGPEYHASLWDNPFLLQPCGFLANTLCAMPDSFDSIMEPLLEAKETLQELVENTNL